MTESLTTANPTPRIAIVIGQLGHGGAERQVALLAEEMQQRRDFVPVVFCMSDVTEPYGSVLSDAGVEWYAAPSVSLPRLWRLLWLIRKLSKSHYSLVYGVLNAGNIYGGAAALVHGIPFIGSIRNANDTLSASYRIPSGFFSRRARVVIANSPSCVNSLRRVLGVHHDRVRVIPNAVVLSDSTSDARQRLRQQWGISEQALVVGTVANLKAQKRVSFFLQVATTTLNHLHDVPLHFVWIGDGSERTTAEEHLTQLPQSLAARIHFPGARLDIADCLAAFDVFVLTSAYEGMPNALLEAMEAGLPCVATDVSGTRDVLQASHDGEIGVLTDAHNPTSFASALVDLLQNADRMRQMAACAQQHVREEYGVQTMVSKFCEVFSDTQSKKGLAS